MTHYYTNDPKYVQITHIFANDVEGLQQMTMNFLLSDGGSSSSFTSVSNLYPKTSSECTQILILNGSFTCTYQVNGYEIQTKCSLCNIRQMDMQMF